MKNKKLMIIISAIVMIVAIASITLWLVFKDKIENNKTESTFTAYVDINPLIKLNFKVTCDKDNNCSSPVVTESELINEDAKTIYKDLVLKDKSLSETIELLANTVKDNDIAFTEIHIYSNYDNEEAFKVNSVDYEIKLDIKKDEDLNTFIDELVTKKEQNITEEIEEPTTSKEMTISMLVPKKVQEMSFEFQIFNGDCTQFVFIEHPELYVSRGKVKVTVSGPTEVINSLPDSVTLEDAFDFPIQAVIEVNDYTLGEHTTTLNITSEIPEIKASPASIKLKYEVRRKYDIQVCAVPLD